MARTKEAAEIIARRKAQKAARSTIPGIDQSWHKFIRCGLCGELFCCNNYSDRKPRAFRWLGRICCPYCRYRVKPIVEKMIRDKTLKVRKKALEV